MKGKMLLGALALFSVGTLVGILLAPEKDPKIPKRKARKSGAYLEDMKEKLEDLKDKYEGLMDRMDEKYKAIKNNTSQLKDKARAEAGNI